MKFTVEGRTGVNHRDVRKIHVRGDKPVMVYRAVYRKKKKPSVVLIYRRIIPSHLDDQGTVTIGRVGNVSLVPSEKTNTKFIDKKRN